MDPNATVRLLMQALEDHDTEEVATLRRDLRNWVNRGGFEPSEYPNWRNL